MAKSDGTVRDDEMITLGEVAVRLRVQPARLFARGVAGEFQLIKVNSRNWGLRRWEADTLAARLEGAACR